MRLLVGFLGGVVVGAIAALLFAPIPGQELRAQVTTKAGSQWNAVQSQWQKSMQNMPAELASLQTQDQALAQKEE